MDNELFEKWCRRATSEIRYKPDRQAVYKELMDHLEDRKRALEDQGINGADAAAQALAGMGSAAQIAPELGDIHRPFWGYVYRVTRAAAVALCALVLLFIVVDVVGTVFDLLSVSDRSETMHPGDGQQWILVTQEKPQASAWCDGHWINIPDACLWQRDSDYRLCLHFQSISLSPYNSFEAYDYFWAVDDQGNYYNSRDEGHYKDVPCVRIGGGLFSGRYQCIDMDVWGIPTGDIQWLELHYDRDGRNIVLRIDFTGGDVE